MQGMLTSIFAYYDSIMLHVPFAQTLGDMPVWKTKYDLIAWRESDNDPRLAQFKFASRQGFKTKIDPRVKARLTAHRHLW